MASTREGFYQLYIHWMKATCRVTLKIWYDICKKAITLWSLINGAVGIIGRGDKILTISKTIDKQGVEIIIYWVEKSQKIYKRLLETKELAI